MESSGWEQYPLGDVHMALRTGLDGALSKSLFPYRRTGGRRIGECPVLFPFRRTSRSRTADYEESSRHLLGRSRVHSLEYMEYKDVIVNRFLPINLINFAS